MWRARWEEHSGDVPFDSNQWKMYIDGTSIRDTSLTPPLQSENCSLRGPLSMCGLRLRGFLMCITFIFRTRGLSKPVKIREYLPNGNIYLEGLEMTVIADFVPQRCCILSVFSFAPAVFRILFLPSVLFLLVKYIRLVFFFSFHFFNHILEKIVCQFYV